MAREGMWSLHYNPYRTMSAKKTPSCHTQCSAEMENMQLNTKHPAGKRTSWLVLKIVGFYFEKHQLESNQSASNVINKWCSSINQSPPDTTRTRLRFGGLYVDTRINHNQEKNKSKTSAPHCKHSWTSSDGAAGVHVSSGDGRRPDADTETNFKLQRQTPKKKSQNWTK